MRLSRRLQISPDVIDSSLKRLNCVSQDIVEIDIHPTVLSLLSTAAPDEVRRAVAELPPHDAAKEDDLDFNSAGMNTALAFSLHTVLLSRNRLTSLLGIIQFRSTVRLSLLGNKVQRIEDCEALSLLPSLQYLSLEFNPVTSLPHYRGHILRICSWPECLHPKNCRLKKLDTRPVLPAEVERAAQCLQREKVTMGELVHRMRFLALLTEAEQRIALHHELRRRGFILQDPVVSLTVENVVTRCSAQLLSLVDVSAATHLARRLMGGRCRLCATSSATAPNTVENSLVGDTPSDADMSRVAASFSHSLSSSNFISLRNPNKAALTAFCKDWSKDVFRRVMASLDHHICALLLSIAHALDEELTVMDVDHLNKLWFMQVAKVDAWSFHQRQKHNNTPIVNRKPSPNPAKKGKVHSGMHYMTDLTQEELVRIALSPGVHADAGTDKDAASLCGISPIAQRAVEREDVVATHDSKESSCHVLEFSWHELHRMNGDVAAMRCAEVNGKQEEGEEDARASDKVSVETPREAPVPFPTLGQKEQARGKELLFVLHRRLKQRVLYKWQVRAWHRRQNTLCAAFIQKRLAGLLAVSLPTPYAITTTLQLLPRTERKRVLFRLWREQARISYAPRSFRLGQLLMRWRWRTYEQQSINTVAASRRARMLVETWSRWCEMLRSRIAAAKYRSNNHSAKVEEVTAGATPLVTVAASTTSRSRSSGNDGLVPEPKMSAPGGPRRSTPDARTVSEQLHGSCAVWSQSRAATDMTPGLTCSSKPSVEAIAAAAVAAAPTATAVTTDDAMRSLHAESTPGVVARLSLPMMTPCADASPQIRLPPPPSFDKATQAEVPLPSLDDLAREYKDAVRAEAEEVVAAMQADRVRLVDRVIALEQRANEEAVRVKHRNEEIRDLRQKLTAMTLREECMKSTITDYKREVEHMRAVVEALRAERREVLRPIVR
ncbi:hypothetical protein DQ04_00111250 [Trypanosoma grayi]|uniref:hypothetical protein n=1 Tax=Trypanosoma grayi TaxID=71804 RepID=UPI0004F40ADF|nr:hypothetical protein DQ04_00111250 [Trypanosoma grayi]KEG15325.1 hypothetical protein DQ04_00111250 [Trypanosoma grayi]